MTSQGINGRPLPTGVQFEAGIACILYDKKGACKTTETNVKEYPYITQTGDDREDNPSQYIANIHDGTVVGYKYFDMQGASMVKLAIRGQARGRLAVYTDMDVAPIADVGIDMDDDSVVMLSVSFEAKYGALPLYLRYTGDGNLGLMTVEVISYV